MAAREVAFPQVGGLAQVPVGVDDDLVPGVAHASPIRPDGTPRSTVPPGGRLAPHGWPADSVPRMTRVCVVGVGLSDGPVAPGMSSTMLTAQSFRRALDDAGLEKGDVGGHRVGAATAGCTR